VDGETTAATLGVLFLSSLCRSTFGFGDALLAMPVLVLVVGPTTATPLVGLVAITISGSIAVGSWRRIDWAAAWRLVVASAAATPVGLLLLRGAPEEVVKGLLGAVCVAYGLYGLAAARRARARREPAAGDGEPAAEAPAAPRLRSDGWAWPFGLVAGCLGGAYNTNGPPVVVYGTLRGWEPERFRVSLQGYFFPAGVVVAAAHAANGLWTADVLRLYGLGLPVVALALLLGGWLHRRIPPRRFVVALYLLLVGLGVALVVP